MADEGLYDSDDDDDDAPVLVSLMEKDEVHVQSSSQQQQIQTTLETSDEDHHQQLQLPPCPVTILSGFLGSGKTTLIQFILRSPDHGKRIAVIENEFGGGDGREGLSVETIIARDGANQDNLTDLVELPNGCVCCTVKDSLVTTLETLLEKRTNLDYILIEASGMANPGPIASLFWLDDALESRLRLDGVVTLVDAYHIRRQLMETEEAAQQIAYADRILLNKVDLVDSNETQRVVSRIRALHPTAPIRHTTYSQVPDLDWILDANCYDTDRIKEVDEVLSDLQKEPQHLHSSSCAEDTCDQCHGITTATAALASSKFLPTTTTHTHTSSIGTIALVQEGSVDLHLINKWLAMILWPNQDEQDKVLRTRLEGAGGVDGGEVSTHSPAPTSTSHSMQLFRIKGILSVRHGTTEVVDEEDEPFVDGNGLDVRRFIVQAVHDLWEIHPASDEWQWNRSLDDNEHTLPVRTRTCKLVLIGRFLKEEELRAGFKSCFTHPLE